MLRWETVKLVAYLDEGEYVIEQDEDDWAVKIITPDGGVDYEVCGTLEEAKEYCENTAAAIQAEE
jgi:hypothetical protein